MKLDVPYRKQVNDYMCGPATLQMVLAFFGDYRSQRKVRKLMMASPRELETRSADNNKMVKAVQRAGFYAYVNDYSSLAELKYFISQGYPVVVNYIEPSDEDGHFAVAKGYNTELQTIILSDPWNGDDFMLPEEQFMTRWHAKWWRASEGYKGHWLMVVSKKPIKIGKLFTPQSELKKYGSKN